MAQGVTAQDYEVYARYMQSQHPANNLPPMAPKQQQVQDQPQGYDKGGLVSKINPFYTYSVGLRNLHKLDDNPPVQNGVLPVAPALGPAMEPVGLGSLVPQEPGNPVVPQPLNKMSYARGGIVSLPLQQRMAQAMRYYTGMGYTPAQAAGIVGNLAAESNLNPMAAGDRVNGQPTSFGMMQAHNDRAQALRNYGGNNWQDFNTQLGFVPHELSTSEKAAGRHLANAKNVEQATQAMIGYERPQGWTADNPTAGHNYAGRLRYAQQAYNMYGGVPTAAQNVASVANVAPDITNSAQATQLAAAAPAAQAAQNAMAEGQAAAQAAQAAQAAGMTDQAASDPLGGLMGLMMMGQMQQAAPPPAAAGPVRKAQPVDPEYQTAITSQTPNAYAEYLRRRQQMMGA
jgi:hypothetical protein